jgi:hypothetical protein
VRVYRYSINIRLPNGEVRSKQYEATVTSGEDDPEELLRNFISESGWKVEDWTLADEYDEEAHPDDL